MFPFFGVVGCHDCTKELRGANGCLLPESAKIAHCSGRKRVSFQRPAADWRSMPNVQSWEPWLLKGANAMWHVSSNSSEDIEPKGILLEKWLQRLA